jgi:hypothetical protein
MANESSGGRVTPSKQAIMESAVSAQHARTGDTVTVACCMPGGILLELSEIVDKSEQTPLGLRTVKESVRRPELGTFRVRGPTMPHGVHASFPIIAGRFALTPGIPKDFWERWLEINKHSDIVKNKVIFAHSTTDGATNIARDLVKSGIGKTGFEALDVTSRDDKGRLKDTRVPGRGKGGIETAEESVKPKDIMPVEE